MPLLYPFSVKIHTKKRSANGSHSFPIFVCESELFLLIVLLHNPYQLVFVTDLETYCFYLYTLQSKTLTITNDVDVSITKYFLERR